MAITFDNVTTNAGTSSFSHTVSTSDDRILFVSTLGGSAFTDNITGVTYNGVSMTLVGKSATPGDRWNYLWYLLSPATGSNTIAITKSSSDYGAQVASSYIGVAQQAPEASSTTSGTDTGGKTQSITTLTTGAWLVGAMTADTSPTAGDNTTYRGDRLFDSNNGQGTPGSYHLELGWSGSFGWSYIIAAIAPANPTEGIYYENSTYNSFSGVAGFTQSHTCTGSNRFLVVMFHINDGDFCDDVTYNGISMTQSIKQTTALGDTLYIYTLANPASGANDVVMTTTSGSSHSCEVGIQSYINTKQSSPTDGTDGQVGVSVTSEVVSITTTVDNDWLVGICRTSTTQTASTNTFKRGVSGLNGFYDTNSAQTPAGSKSMTVTFASSYSDFLAVAFSPYIESETGDNFMMGANF